MKRFFNLFVLIAFCCSNFSSSLVFAQIADLPKPGTMVNVSAKGDLPLLKGLRLNPDNPLKMDFIIEPNGAPSVSKDDAARLARYFLAALAMPKEDTWVNLSPYESQRIVPQAMADTDLGKDLLEQDYLLKQLASSLTYPESESGKQYWNEINGVGANNHSPTNNFNKVWIIPNKSSVYENGNTVLISESSLAVKTEEDYLAVRQNTLGGRDVIHHVSNNPDAINRVSTTEPFKQHILPLIEQDVNQGKNFAQLRQIYSALILAGWFKSKFFDSFYKNYINQAKTKGITIDEKNSKDKIYALYLEAFKKGAYNYVKKESVGADNYSPVHKITSRQYFSGGCAIAVGTPAIGPATQPSTSAVEALGQVETGAADSVAADLHHGAVAPRLLALDDPQAKVEMVDPQAILGDAPLKAFDKVQVTVSKPISGLEGRKSISYPNGDARALYIWVNSGLSADEQKQQIFYELCYYAAADEPRVFEDAIVQARQAVRASTNITSGALTVFERQLRELNYAQRENWSGRRAGQWERYLRDYFRPAFDDVARRRVAYEFSLRYQSVPLPAKEADWLELIRTFDTRDIYGLLKVPTTAVHGGGESHPVAAKRVGPQSALVSDDLKRQLDTDTGMIREFDYKPDMHTRIGQICGYHIFHLRVFPDHLLGDNHAIYLRKIGNTTHVIAVGESVVSEAEKEGLPFLMYHELCDHKEQERVANMPFFKFSGITPDELANDSHRVASGNEIRAWWEAHPYTLLPRHLHDINDPQRAEVLRREWKDGWLPKHQEFWTHLPFEAYIWNRYTFNDILEKYARLMNQRLEILAGTQSDINDEQLLRILANGAWHAPASLDSKDRAGVKSRLEHILFNLDNEGNVHADVWREILQKITLLDDLEALLGGKLVDIVKGKDSNEFCSLIMALAWMNHGTALRHFAAECPRALQTLEHLREYALGKRSDPDCIRLLAVIGDDFKGTNTDDSHGAAKQIGSQTVQPSQKLRDALKTNTTKGFIREEEFSDGANHIYIARVFRDEVMQEGVEGKLVKYDAVMLDDGKLPRGALTTDSVPVVAARESVWNEPEGRVFLFQHETGEDELIRSLIISSDRNGPESLIVRAGLVDPYEHDTDKVFIALLIFGHRIAAGQEVAAWVKYWREKHPNEPLQLLPRHRLALQDPARREILIKEWDQGWLKAHRDIWSMKTYDGKNDLWFTPEGVAALEEYAGLLHSQAVAATKKAGRQNVAVDPKLLEKLQGYAPERIDLDWVTDARGQWVELRVIDASEMAGFDAVYLRDQEIYTSFYQGVAPIVTISRKYYQENRSNAGLMGSLLREAIVRKAVFSGNSTTLSGAAKKPGASSQDVVKAAIDKARKDGKLYVLRSQDFSSQSGQAKMAGPQNTARINRIIDRLEGIVIDCDFVRYAFPGSDRVPAVPGDLAQMLRQDTNILLAQTDLEDQSYYSLLAKTDVDDRDYYSSRNYLICLVLKNGLQGLEEMSDRQIAEILFENAVKQRIYGMQKGGNPWSDEKEVASHKMARDMIAANKPKLDAAFGAAQSFGAAKKPSKHTMIISQGLRDKLLSKKTMLSEFTRNGNTFLVFAGGDLEDNDAILLDSKSDGYTSNYTIAITQEVANDGPNALDALATHEWLENQKYITLNAFRTSSEPASFVEEWNMRGRAHRFGSAHEVLSWWSSHPGELLPRHIRALKDPKRAADLVEEWNSGKGWLARHKKVWQDEGFRDVEVNILEQYARLFNKQAVGGEDFRGLDTKASGKFDKIELKGTDLKDLGDLNVQITAIVPFRP